MFEWKLRPCNVKHNGDWVSDVIHSLLILTLIVCRDSLKLWYIHDSNSSSILLVTTMSRQHIFSNLNLLRIWAVFQMLLITWIIMTSYDWIQLMVQDFSRQGIDNKAKESKKTLWSLEETNLFLCSIYLNKPKQLCEEPNLLDKLR